MAVPQVNNAPMKRAEPLLLTAVSPPFVFPRPAKKPSKSVTFHISHIIITSAESERASERRLFVRSSTHAPDRRHHHHCHRNLCLAWQLQGYTIGLLPKPRESQVGRYMSMSTRCKGCIVQKFIVLHTDKHNPRRHGVTQLTAKAAKLGSRNIP